MSKKLLQDQTFKALEMASIELIVGLQEESFSIF